VASLLPRLDVDVSEALEAYVSLLSPRKGLLILALLVFSCFSQDSTLPSQAGSVATLRSTTRLVVLDVVVTDKSGKPVRNLSKEDFTILEDGKDQAIASFEPPDQHSPPPVEQKKSWPEQSNEPSAAPAISSSALTILVLDELDTRILDQAFARDEIRKFLRSNGARLPEPTALMALEEKRLELLHDYTNNAAELEQALQHHPAELPFCLMSGEGVVALRNV
jgi:VWFA-related protein